jgi:hypothetical protein
MLGLALALACALAVASCEQTGHATGPTGQLAGTVVAAPTCPVERAGSSCAPLPVTNRAVTIETPAGGAIATTMTDANGRFTVTLAPGAYVVHVAIVPGGVGIRQVTPGDVTIRAGQTATLTIVLDTGIR